MRYINRTIIIVLAIVIIGGCKKRDDRLRQWQDYSEQTIRMILSRPLSYPDSSKGWYPDSLSVLNIMDKDVKVVFNVNIDCSTCLHKFKYWNYRIDSLQSKYHVDIPVLAIVSSDRERDIRREVDSLWDRPWIYDPKKQFVDYNDIEDERLQALLLGKSDSVVLVGDPLLNTPLGKLYEKTIVSILVP